MNTLNEKDNYSAARYDGELYDHFDFSDEFASLAYDSIIHLLDGSEQVKRLDNGILFEPIGLSLSCSLQRMGESNGRFSAEMLFILDHELFDEPLCEYTAGVGKSAEEAVTVGADQFTSVVLMSIISAFGCKGDHIVSAEFAGKIRKFRRSCSSFVYSIGKAEHEMKDLFEIIEDSLPDYLGSKKAYWVKLFAYRCGNDMECEARINGALMNDLSNLLKPYVESWDSSGVFHCEKQFVLLLDTDLSREKEPISPEKIIALSEQAVDLFGSAFTEDDTMYVFAKLKEICAGCGSLAQEIRALVPEIYTCAILGIKQGDSIRLMADDAEITLKKPQLREYGYIEQGVLRYLGSHQPKDEFSLNVMQLGSVLDAVNDAVANGAKLENIYLRELTLHVPSDFVLS